jgi:hypothetical protein
MEVRGEAYASPLVTAIEVPALHAIRGPALPSKPPKRVATGVRESIDQSGASAESARTR